MQNTCKKKNKQIKIDFSKALEYIDAPISNFLEENTNHLSRNNNLLKDLMLRELNNLSDIIVRHPDFKINKMNYQDKQALKQFLNYFSECPICHQKNHIYNLKKVFIEEDRNILNALSRLKGFNGKLFNKIKFKFGIPCCNCYKRVFGEDL